MYDLKYIQIRRLRFTKLCAKCNQEIDAGETCYYHVYVFNYEFFADYICFECDSKVKHWGS